MGRWEVAVNLVSIWLCANGVVVLYLAFFYFASRISEQLSGTATPHGAKTRAEILTIDAMRPSQSGRGF
jgi:hypothetical protein